MLTIIIVAAVLFGGFLALSEDRSDALYFTALFGLLFIFIFFGWLVFG